MKRTWLAVAMIVSSCLAAHAVNEAQGKATRGRITGLVTDEAKRPITDAILGIAETTAKGEINEMAPMTNEQGVFEWTDLPAGQYVLSVNAPGFKALKQPVEVKASATTKAVFVLKQ